MEHHLIMKHFKSQADAMVSVTKPYSCLVPGCSKTDRFRSYIIQNHLQKHGIFEKLAREELEKKDL